VASPIIIASSINARAYSQTHTRSMNQHVQKVRGSRSTPRSILIIFIRTMPHIKRKELLIDVLFYPYTFNICNTTYKKQGAPDQCPVLSLYVLHAQCRIQKARGSRLMSRFICVFFYTRSVTGSRPMIIILFIYNNHRCMKARGVYIHISII
jgi:hypothetical protein